MLGIIGGSGIYALEGLTNATWHTIDTPFGRPSDQLLLGEFEGVKVAFLPRHGRGHRIPPSQLNVRANIAALKQVGCTDVLSLSAVGSLREDLPPGTFVAVDQTVDHTRHRNSSFFGEGVVAHVSLAHPTCGRLIDAVMASAKDSGTEVRRGATYVCIEGPHFSSQAESKIFRQWGCDVIGMTALPEVKLAREAELCFATVAMVTDFDCWHPDHDAVTAAQVVETFHGNVVKARALLAKFIPRMKQRPAACPKGCDKALEHAQMTAQEVRDAGHLARLASAGLRVGVKPAKEDPHDLVKHIRTVPDWPKKGIQFRDVTTLLENGAAFRRAVDAMTERYRGQRLDAVVGVDARGFIFGGALAISLGVGFVPARKKSKLPGETLRAEYQLEYGVDTLELRAQALGPGQRVVVIDDLIATGGTAEAAIKLARLRSAEVVEACFVIELPELKGRKRIEGLGVPVHTLCHFEGE